MKRCVLFDIDGTLADVRHRLHHLERDPKDWISFHDDMVNDQTIEPVAWLAKTLDLNSDRDCDGKKFDVIVVSARHEDYRYHTRAWLEAIGLVGVALYMRANDDRRPDHEVKADILQRIVADGYDPFLVIDDRPEVVAMWRDWGLTCLQCAPDEPVSKYSGQNLLTLLIGPAGAGKSTYAADKYPTGTAKVISSDEIRKEEGLGHSQDDLALTFKLARGYVKARIDAGRHTVVDATNLKLKDRMAFVRLAPKDTTITYVLIDRDYDEKIGSRGWRPVELIDKHHRMFRDTTLAQVKNADGLPNVIVQDVRKKK